jgi:hypothetical protein
MLIGLQEWIMMETSNNKKMTMKLMKMTQNKDPEEEQDINKDQNNQSMKTNWKT